MGGGGTGAWGGNPLSLYKKTRAKISLDSRFLNNLKGPQGRVYSSKGAKRPCSYLLQANQPFRILGHRIVECVAGVHFLLEVVGELLGHFRIVTGELLVAVFGVDVFCDRDRRLLGVEDKRSLSFGGESRVVTEQSPVTGIHSHLLVFQLAVEIETVVDAGAVADDQGRSTVSWRRQLSSCRRRREHKSVALSLLQLTCAVV